MALTNLTDTKWQFYSEIGLSLFDEDFPDGFSFDIDFVSNNTHFESFSLVTENETIEEETVKTHKLYYGDTLIADDETTEYPPEYAVVNILGGVDSTNVTAIFIMSYAAVRLDITESFRVQRKTLDGTSQEYDFGTPGMQFLVKNLSDGDILVNFEDLTNDNATASALIPKETAQVIVTNTGFPKKEFSSIYVKGAGTGDVEVQMILW